MKVNALLRSSLLSGLLATGLSSCASRDVSPPGVFFSSEPPGARILVDGADSGYVTPRMIALDHDERYLVELRLAGFDSHAVLVEPHRRVSWIPWDDGVISFYGLTMPLYLAVGELFVPRRVNRVHAPSRVYVRLEPESTDG